jgi:heptosyltransferase II
MMRTLIIKTGHTETFDKSNASLSIVSLGDVLRTTVLLHLLKESEVTWLTSPEARPLLENNPHIHQIATSPENIKERWDLVINLEETETAFRVLQRIQYKKLAGFGENSMLQTLTKPFEIPALKNWSEKLFLLMDYNWSGEGYVFTPSKKTYRQFDLGLNWKVGPKWSNKSWPESHWEHIYERVKNQYRTSWQQGFDNLEEYIFWIQSCKTLLTHDSLGLHLGLALGKKMVALFGPTLSREIPLKDTLVLSHNKIHCVGQLSVDLVEYHLRNQVLKSSQEYNEQFTA